MILVSSSIHLIPFRSTNQSIKLLRVIWSSFSILLPWKALSGRHEADGIRENERSKFVSSYCDLETFVIVDIETVHPSFHPNRGVIFFIALFIFILLSILLIRLYSSYKYRENRKQFNYHCLNQFDAGQYVRDGSCLTERCRMDIFRLHQWYDLARFLNDHQHTDEYEQIRNDLQELHPATDPTARLMGYEWLR